MSLLSYYASELLRVLGRPARLVGFLVACGMHAVGHAAVALVAGAFALMLVRSLGGSGQTVLPLGLDVEHGGALVLSVVGLAVIAGKTVAGVYATFVQARVAGEVGGALRLTLLDALLAIHRLRRPRHDDHGLGAQIAPVQAIATLTDRVHDVERGLQLGLVGGARAGAQLVPLAGVLFVLAPRMAAVAVGVLGVFGVLLARLRSGYRAADRRGARQRAHLLEAADEAVRHADLWVTYGAEAKARAAVRAMGRALSATSARLEARAAALSGANEVLGAAALVVAVLAARAGWLGGDGGGASLLAFAVAFFLAYRPLREIAEARLAFARAQGAYDELRGVMVDDAVPFEPSAQARAWSAGALELRGLRLARGLCGLLSLRVSAGAIVAIAGPTGVGKTTLLRTLLGLDAAAGGQILFDGAPIDEAPAGPSGRPFAWVPQDAPLLADTLAGNVTLGAPDRDAREALTPIGAGRLMGDLRDDRLGPGGRAVSGGERQWIAIARAIATRQPVQLLDEPTSGLDAESQRRVLEAIARLRGKRTVVIVTHRPEPLAVADEVVRLVAA